MGAVRGSVGAAGAVWDGAESEALVGVRAMPWLRSLSRARWSSPCF